MPSRKLSTLLLALGVLWSAGALAAAHEDAERLRECRFCGMDRKAYGFSRALLRYEDGEEVGACSLHCALVELQAHPDRRVKVLLVADRNTHDLLEAEAAHWVMGGRKRPVMAARPKWAFATREAAEAFVRDQGGAIAPWAEILAAAREDVAREQEAALARRRSAGGCMASARP